MEFKKLKKSEIASLLNTELSQAVSFSDSKLSMEREENLEYYRGNLPEAKQRGRSKYVSSDVFDTVQSLKSSLLETFSGNTNIIEFPPQNGEDTESARIATEFTNYVFYRQNCGYDILDTVIQDGLVNRIGVVKPYWKASKRCDTYEFEGIDMMTLAQLIEQDVEIKELDEVPSDDPYGLPTYTGTYEVETDTSYVAIDALAPEEFIISERAKSIKDARIVAHRVKASVSSLMREGYSKSIAIKAYESAKEKADDVSREEIVRYLETSDNGRTSSGLQAQTEEFWIYEVYAELDVEGEGKAELQKVTLAGDVVLDIEEVNDKPFFVFSPLAEPHALIGSSVVDRLKPIQNAKTTLTRSILDHTVITNNPRLQVVKGTLHNPRELMDDRLGGLVNVTRPDGIFPIPQSPMNPYAFNTIQMLDTDKEQATGVSRLSQGMNKDAVSKQNSSDMVNGMVSLSMQRQKTIARNLAERFLKPLFVYIYKLVLENETKESIIDVAGAYVEVDPTKWMERTSANAQITIGYQEAEKESQELQMIYNQLSADPVLAPGFDYEKRWNLQKRILSKKGIKDVQNYITEPKALTPPPPNPIDEIQVALQKQALDINERQTANMEHKLKLEEYRIMRGAELDETRVEADIVTKADKQQLDDRKFIHGKTMDIFEQSIVQKVADEQGAISASANVTTGGS